MPYYGMPVGTEYEEVGFGFNKSIITGLLRERYGFDGIVCTDWGLITDAEIFGEPFPARAWGVEHLTPRERMVKVLDAGVDQFGGEADPRAARRARRARATSARSASTTRPAACCARSSCSASSTSRYVDVERAGAIVGSGRVPSPPARPRSAPRSRC